MSLIKHWIKFTDLMPFKESSSCTVHGLVQKDGSLRFCIDLRKLSSWTVKDAFSLPRIDETLDSLQGSQWFSSLNLKSGYWQVEMDKESKLVTAFTIGPLGFYECDRMPLRLTNTPATFQLLMKT